VAFPVVEILLLPDKVVDSQKHMAAVHCSTSAEALLPEVAFLAADHTLLAVVEALGLLDEIAESQECMAFPAAVEIVHNYQVVFPAAAEALVPAEVAFLAAVHKPLVVEALGLLDEIAESQ
jgi:hypothetical protein